MNKMSYFLLQKNIRDAIPERQQQNFDLQFAGTQKSEATGLVLSLLLGALGIDRMYIGQPIRGVLKLCTLGLCGIWTIIDWFLIMGLVRARNIEIANRLSSFMCNK